MSRKGNPWDNAACESFMKSLKYEEVLRNEYRDLGEARRSIIRFLEQVYNEKRLHSALGYCPPAEFEQNLMARKQAAQSVRRRTFMRQLVTRRGEEKGAHNRETLQTTGRTTRIVIVPREFAPIPHAPAGLRIPMAIRMRFLRHGGIYRSDVVQVKTKPWGGTVPPPAGRPRAQVKERVGRTTPFSSSSMSSGRLFLDRVARQHCPSPLRRHGQNNPIARSEGTNYHRTVSSVLTVCVSSGGRHNSCLCT